MQRSLAVLAIAACVFLPLLRSQAAASTPGLPNAAKLRVPANAFLPATLATDEVEDNAAASANYIGTHHSGSYDQFGRLSGYYQKAVFGGVVYVRYQASVFPDVFTAQHALSNFAQWAAGHFGEPQGPGVLSGTFSGPPGGSDCEGDKDADDNGQAPSKDDVDVTCAAAPSLPSTDCENDHDGDDQGGKPDGAGDVDSINCQFTAPEAVAYGVGFAGCENDGDSDDSGSPPIDNDNDLTCPGAGMSVGEGVSAGANVNNPLCEPDGDDDDSGATPSAADVDATCNQQTANATAGPALNPGATLPITDCSPQLGMPCSLLGISFITPTDGRSWDEIYGILQVNECLSEVTVTAGSSYARAAPFQLGQVFANVLGASQQVLADACPALPTPTAAPVPPFLNGAPSTPVPSIACAPDLDSDDTALGERQGDADGDCPPKAPIYNPFPLPLPLGCLPQEGDQDSDDTGAAATQPDLDDGCF